MRLGLQRLQGIGIDPGIRFGDPDPAGFQHQVEMAPEPRQECGREEPPGAVVHPVVGQDAGPESWEKLGILIPDLPDLHSPRCSRGFWGFSEVFSSQSFLGFEGFWEEVKRWELGVPGGKFLVGPRVELGWTKRELGVGSTRISWWE